MLDVSEIWLAYRLRWKRRRLLLRALRKRKQLRLHTDRTAQIEQGDILGFATLRNECLRLPFFLRHYRQLGVRHFLIVDNGSTDGTVEYLMRQPDVSLWQTPHSYRLSRFGMDWLTGLQMKYGHGHWCLTVDADEILIYPHHETRDLTALVDWLERTGRRSFGALMLDMYPKGPLGAQAYKAGDDPFRILCWFDRGDYTIRKKPDLQNLWIQGGVRSRVFFSEAPERGPTLGKVPLVKWNRRFAYVSSTHSVLPRRLNHVYEETGGERLSGILLHSKFLPSIVEKSVEEKARQEHFRNSRQYDDYYDGLSQGPVLWCNYSTRYQSWRQLESIGLMSRGNWV